MNKILIGNKCDVDDSARAVSKSEGESLAREYSMAFFETSAKKDIGVSEAFHSIAKQVVDRLSKEGGVGGRNNNNNRNTNTESNVDLKNKEKGKGGGGCCGK